MEQITYGDGRSVQYSYNALRQLTEIEDWLGITRIELDEAGRAKQITAHKGRQVRYQWGRLGERTGLVYPDGRKVSYEYDEWSRLSRLIDGNREIQYHYREDGRLSEKVFSDGLITSYDYNEMGLVSSLTHQQGEKKLEQYRYTYDHMGNKTQIEKRRAECFRAEGVPEEISRKLSQERGIYQYRYDKLNRLTEVLHGNETVSSYVYDAFGNRIQSKHGYEERRYEYNAANQLLRSVTGGRVECCQYDKRGNLTEIIRDDRVIYRYRYDETNRLAEAVNGSGQAVRYEYNGLGNRVGRKEYRLECFAGGGTLRENPALPKDPVRETEYLLDLTKPYHNLLERRENTEGEIVSQIYTWDSNVVYATEGESAHMYLQDELGSPVRLVGVKEDNSKGTQQTVYGYDEFGNDRYGTQGEVQPFGYTGYQKDAVTNTYFAQAREYLPKVGRFGGEDIKKGTLSIPNTFCFYSYCYNNPFYWIDLNGMEAEFYEFTLDPYNHPAGMENERVYPFVANPSNAIPNVAGKSDTSTYIIYTDDTFHKENDMSTPVRRRAEELVLKGQQVELGIVTSAEDFNSLWNQIDENLNENVNVEVFTHGRPYCLIFREGSATNAISYNGKNSTGNSTDGDVQKLQFKDIDRLYLNSCNAGHLDFYHNQGKKVKDPNITWPSGNLASEFSKKISGDVYAFDGNVSYTSVEWNYCYPRLSKPWSQK